MPLPARLSRRLVAIGLSVVAVLALAFVVAALWNPWRYVALYPLAQQGGAVGVLVLAGACAATAALLSLPSTVRGAVTGLLASLVAIPALCIGLPVVVFHDRFRGADTATPIAVSPGGEFVAILTRGSGPDGEFAEVSIRYQAGLLTRDADQPLARCTDAGIVVDSVRFTGRTTVALPMAEDPTVVVRFDPGSLRPESTVALC